MRTIAAMVAGVLVTGVAAVAIGASAPPCEYEDGSTQMLCRWDGGSMGNGVGMSFYSLDHGRITIYDPVLN